MAKKITKSLQVKSPLEDIEPFLSTPQINVKEAMRQIGNVGERILFIVDAQRSLLGSLSDGDIRRWVLKEGSLASPIECVYNKEPLFVEESYNIELVKDVMLEKKLQAIPVVNSKKKIVDILLWNNVFGHEDKSHKQKIKVPVVIMAGGKGTRLDPFTKILPKPLIPVGDKAIIEIIIDKLHEHGMEEFFVSVNYKSRMIKAFFEEIDTPYKIHYIEEKKPLGTAGSLKYLTNKVKDHILVSNCDIIVDADYSEMFNFHVREGCDLTMIGSFRHFTIPYGVCTIENGRLIDLVEKPEFDYLVNTGMCFIKKETLKFIPSDQFFQMTDLISKIKERNGSVGVYPIDAKSWIDVGQWDEYQQSLKDLKLI